MKTSKNLSAKYYQESTEKLQNKEEKGKTWLWTYKRLSEDEKNKLVEYRKKL